MDALTPFLDQIKGVWNDASSAARVGLSALAAACVAIVVGVGMWSSQPEYVPLANGLTPTKAKQLADRLDAEQISYELTPSGAGVAVDSSQWARARMLTADLTDDVGGNQITLDTPLLGDPSLNHFRLLRHKEAQLAASISRIQGVKTATVHISQPESSPFFGEQEPTTASVVLTLEKQNFQRSQAGAIVAMLATSVEGLNPEDVNVVDTRGRLLYTYQSGPANELNDQFEFRQRLQMELATKAQRLLAEMLGHGKSSVQITADVDFTQTERTETTYNPELKVKKREKTTSITRSGLSKASGGVAGIAANGGGAATGGDNTPFSEKEEEAETDYETPSVVDTVKQASGTLKRLTVAAMVDLSSEGDPLNVSQQEVEELIQRAVGFDAQRGDEITVVQTKFAESPLAVAPEPAGWTWDRIQDLARMSSLGLASLVALVLGLLILKRMKPLETTSEPTAYVTPDRARMLAELTDRAAKDPEAAARIVQAWLGDEPPKQNRRSTDRATVPMPARKAA